MKTCETCKYFRPSESFLQHYEDNKRRGFNDIANSALRSANEFAKCARSKSNYYTSVERNATWLNAVLTQTCGKKGRYHEKSQ